MAGGGVLLSNNKSRGLPPSLKLSWWCVFFSEKENEVRLGEREFTWGHAKGKKREREREIRMGDMWVVETEWKHVRGSGPQGTETGW
jgi:hypothetical protein